MQVIVTTLLAVIIGLSCIFVSCDGQTPGSTTESENVSVGTLETSSGPELPITDPIATYAGYISGTIYEDAGTTIHVYLGIPYAAPPVGDLRWKPPQPVTPWEGVRECTTFGSQAPQDEVWVDRTVPVSEDCLYLNVMTPAEKPSDKLPVMVEFHGGALSWGNCNIDVKLRARFIERDVVLVGVNSRLDVLGLLTHPLLSEESPEGVSGNYMFLDLMAALEWVQKNIAAFGGDPDNVTIFGASGGGVKATALVASPLAGGLFHRAIIESGTIPADKMLLLPEAESLGEELFARLGVDDADDPLAEARALGWEEILEAAESMQPGIPTPFHATVDGWFLLDRAYNVFQTGNQNAVPCIIGFVFGEADRSGPMYLIDFASYCSNFVAGVEKAGAEGYAYIFDQVPYTWRCEGVASYHGLDYEVYLFGNLDEQGIWAMNAQILGIEPLVPGIQYQDRMVSNAMMEMWTKFARTGDPNIEGLIKWPVYQAAKDEYLYIAYPLEVRVGFSEIIGEFDN